MLQALEAKFSGPLDVVLASIAAMEGRVEILRYLRERQISMLEPPSREWGFRILFVSYSVAQGWLICPEDRPFKRPFDKIDLTLSPLSFSTSQVW